VGFRLQSAASADFEHDAHAWQSVGHCPGSVDTLQYWPTDWPAMTVEQGALQTLQLSVAICRQHRWQLGSSEARHPA
jgi:hypothetical protein